jgi:GT2 family glycosyltransferase
MSDTSNPARVSVLMPTFNRGGMLEESLDSVLNQTLTPHQVIVIDDGSTDETEERIKKYSTRVQYVRKDNGGKSSALNAGLRLITGEFVWFFDDDDVALPTSIADRVTVLAARPAAGLVLARHYWGTTAANGKIVAQEEAKWPDVNESNVLLNMMRGCFTMLQGALVRTECLRAVGTFREELLRSQDYDMLVRLVRSFPVAFFDRPTYIHRRHGGERGPAALRHSASSREHVWARYDAMLGKELRRETALGDFLVPPISGGLTEEQTQMALLNRLSVMGSKGLGDECLEDALAFAHLADKSDARKLTPQKRSVAIAAVQQRYFLLNVVLDNGAFLRKARSLASSATGREVLRVFARGLLGMAWWGTKSMRERLRLVELALGLWASSTLPARARSGPLETPR